MQQEEPQYSQTPEPPEKSGGQENLEFKPIVKYAAIGLGLLVLTGTEYAAYSVGYKNGQGAATPIVSSQAQAEVNSLAVENLTHFMQLSSAPDEVLLKTVENHQQELAWIEDERIRHEAMWSLAQAMVDRGMASKAQTMLSGLFPVVPTSDVWARRAVCMAEALAAEGLAEDSLSYYQIAAKQFGELHMDKELLQVISKQVDLLALSGASTDEVVAPLEALQLQASQLGEAGRSKQAEILASMGMIYRQKGDSAAAMRCFEQALSGMDNEHTPELARGAVCYGMALMEKGETEKAESYLRDGVSRLGDDPDGVQYLVAALRELARLEMERDGMDEALGLLYRAEGVATGRMPADSVFWPLLYDQRGWINYEKKLYESAAQDFGKALKGKKHPELLAQPEEGLARSLLDQGKAEGAVKHLEKALKLNQQYRPDDKAAAGRLYILLGNAYDMMPAHAQDAVISYTQAVECLPEDSPDRPGAMMCLGYALNQSSRWADAAKVWEELLPMFKDNATRKEEIRNQLDLCRRHGVAPTTAPGADAASNDAAAPTADTPKRRTSPTRRRR